MALGEYRVENRGAHIMVEVGVEIIDSDSIDP
jgi:hypothetical protein